MIVPVLEQNIKILMPYFPKATWYDYYTGTVVKKKEEEGSKIQVVLQNDYKNNPLIYIRGGNIIAMPTNLTLENNLFN